MANEKAPKSPKENLKAELDARKSEVEAIRQKFATAADAYLAIRKEYVAAERPYLKLKKELQEAEKDYAAMSKQFKGIDRVLEALPPRRRTKLSLSNKASHLYKQRKQFTTSYAMPSEKGLNRLDPIGNQEIFVTKKKEEKK